MNKNRLSELRKSHSQLKDFGRIYESGKKKDIENRDDEFVDDLVMTEDELIKNYLNDMQYMKKIKDFYDKRELTFQILDLSDVFFTLRFLIDILEYGPNDQSEKL